MTERPAVPPSHRHLLDAMTAALATKGRSGLPQVTAVAFLHDPADDLVKVSLNDTRQKTINLRRDPLTTLFVIDPQTPFRTLEIRAEAELLPDPDFVFCARAGAKYGQDFRDRDAVGDTRSIVVLHPRRIVATDISG